MRHCAARIERLSGFVSGVPYRSRHDGDGRCSRTPGRSVILRIWRGHVVTERAAEYADLVRRTGIAGYRETSGNLDAQVAVRDVGDGRSEIIMLSWWTS